MEILGGVILAVAALVVYIAAKRGAEAAQRERVAMLKDSPARPLGGPPPTVRGGSILSGQPPARGRPAAGATGQPAGAAGPSDPGGILARLRRPGGTVAVGTGATVPVGQPARSRGTAAGPGGSAGVRSSAGQAGVASPARRTRAEAGSSWDTSIRGANRAPTRPVRRRELPPIDINSAGVEELQGLPGIGVRAAQRIVAHRERHGTFRSVADLEAVEGFDAHRVARLASRATV
jgi:competence protein ComEA